MRKSIGTTREGCGDRAGAEHSSISQVWLNRMQGGRAVAGGGVPVLTRGTANALPGGKEKWACLRAKPSLWSV